MRHSRSEYRRVLPHGFRLHGSIALLISLLFCSPSLALAEAPTAAAPHVPSFWDLMLGRHASELPVDDFANYTCSVNNTATTIIFDWSHFAACPRDKTSGLHEIQFTYDDEAEYRARAMNLMAADDPGIGTTLYDLPVILTAGFDDNGFLLRLRASTDPRAGDSARMQAISLLNYLYSRYDADKWKCADIPLAQGETPIGRISIKQQCDQTVDDAAIHLEAYYYRLPGEYGTDPRTGLAVAGLFRSEVRFEMRLAKPIDDEAQQVAGLAGKSATPDIDVLRVRAMNCPKCDLSGVNLKRQDLHGANLSGANLSGADLHDVNLSGADLSGANLTGAIMNRGNLRLAKMAGANLANAQLYAARLDGADLSAADMTQAHMGHSELTRSNLQGAKMAAVDLSNARLADTNLRGVDLGGAWLISAQLGRADLTDASLNSTNLTEATMVEAKLIDAKIVQTDFLRANLEGADLSGAHISASRMTSTIMTNTKRDGTVFTNVIDGP